QHAAVTEAAVAVRAEGAGDPRLVAYVVCAAEPPPTSSGLRDHLRRRLPAFMIPAAFVVTERLPRTPAGKLDRPALPAHSGGGGGRGHELTRPRTALEEVLAEIWADVLGVARIGVHDDFFELGGHSLLATRVQHRMRELLQVELPVRSFFESTTVAELAEQVVA